MAEQSFDIVEKLSEELGEKELRIMELEKRLAEEEEEKKKLFDFKEIVELCGPDIFHSINNDSYFSAYELDDIIYDSITDNIARKWGREVDEKTEDGLTLSVYHKLMPQAIEFLHSNTHLSVPFYVKKEPLESYKNFQSQAFLTLKEVGEKIIEMRNEFYEVLDDDDKFEWNTEKLFSFDIEKTIMGVDEDTFDTEDDWIEFLDLIKQSDDRGYCIVNCSFKRNGEDMYMIQD